MGKQWQDCSSRTFHSEDCRVVVHAFPERFFPSRDCCSRNDLVECDDDGNVLSLHFPAGSATAFSPPAFNNPLNKEFNSLEHLRYLDLSNCGKGNMFLGDITSLEVLRLNCEGISLPDSPLKNLVNLVSIELNKVSMVLNDFGPLTKLRQIKFTDVILLDDASSYGGAYQFPESISNLLSLRNVTIHGITLWSLPKSIGSLKNLVWLDLFGNNIRGTPPVEMSQLSNLKYLSLSANHMNGQIPSWLGELRALEELRLDYNNYTGTIPSSFGNLKNLKS
ncbi:hypothetical protein HDU76_007862, partial [Blyttiomyces sp. JEL0837]